MLPCQERAGECLGITGIPGYLILPALCKLPPPRPGSESNLFPEGLGKRLMECYPEGGAGSYSGNCCAQTMDRPSWGPLADADSLGDPQTQNQASSQPLLCPDFQSCIRWSLIEKGEKLKKKKLKNKERKKQVFYNFIQSILTVSLVGKSIMD